MEVGKWIQHGQLFFKKKSNLVLLLLLGVSFAVLAIPTDNKKNESVEKTNINSKDTDIIKSYEKLREEQLADVLGEVQGVGKVKIMVTVGNQGIAVVEKDESKKSDSSEEKTVYEKDGTSGETPYVKENTMPEVEGVVIVAQGGDNPMVQEEIIRAVEALFHIDAHKINVMKMK